MNNTRLHISVRAVKDYVPKGTRAEGWKPFLENSLKKKNDQERVKPPKTFIGMLECV